MNYSFQVVDGDLPTRTELAYFRKAAPKTNYKTIIKEYVKGFVVVMFFLALILGWQIALAAPTCSFSPHTGITTCQ